MQSPLLPQTQANLYLSARSYLHADLNKNKKKFAIAAALIGTSGAIASFLLYCALTIGRGQSLKLLPELLPNAGKYLLPFSFTLFSSAGTYHEITAFFRRSGISLKQYFSNSSVYPIILNAGETVTITSHQLEHLPQALLNRNGIERPKANTTPKRLSQTISQKSLSLLWRLLASAAIGASIGLGIAKYLALTLINCSCFITNQAIATACPGDYSPLLCSKLDASITDAMPPVDTICPSATSQTEITAVLMAWFNNKNLSESQAFWQSQIPQISMAIVAGLLLLHTAKVHVIPYLRTQRLLAQIDASHPAKSDDSSPTVIVSTP